MTDPIALLQDLIRCPSVTPEEGGALTLVENLLSRHGFSCHRLPFSEAGTADVDNLYARWGTSGPHICFAGHTDVVPVGDAAGWSFDPFGGIVKDGNVCGRGASDMKGPIAAFIAAALDFIAAEKPAGSVSFLLTGDEEAVAVNGTRKMLQWLEARGGIPDFCLVGEPTSREKLGDMMKIGRRGSLTGKIAVRGTQGHVAYPHLADNPVPRLVTLLKALDALVLDAGTAHFQPSNLEIVHVDAGGAAHNVIPAAARAVFNVRFNDSYTGKSLDARLRTALDACGIPYEMSTHADGESFYTPPGKWSDIVVEAVRKTTGAAPELSTTGGTSDARFIRNYCPVVEFGITGLTAHKVDERVSCDEMTALTRIYGDVLRGFFAR